MRSPLPPGVDLASEQTQDRARQGLRLEVGLFTRADTPSAMQPDTPDEPHPCPWSFSPGLWRLHCEDTGVQLSAQSTHAGTRAGGGAHRRPWRPTQSGSTVYGQGPRATARGAQ